MEQRKAEKAREQLEKYLNVEVMSCEDLARQISPLIWMGWKGIEKMQDFSSVVVRWLVVILVAWIFLPALVPIIHS